MEQLSHLDSVAVWGKKQESLPLRVKGNVFYNSDAWEFFRWSAFHMQMDWLFPQANYIDQDLWISMWRRNFHLMEWQTEACLRVQDQRVLGSIPGGCVQTYVKLSCVVPVIPPLSILQKTASHQSNKEWNIALRTHGRERDTCTFNKILNALDVKDLEVKVYNCQVKK